MGNLILHQKTNSMEVLQILKKNNLYDKCVSVYDLESLRDLRRLEYIPDAVVVSLRTSEVDLTEILNSVLRYVTSHPTIVIFTEGDLNLLKAFMRVQKKHNFNICTGQTIEEDLNYCMSQKAAYFDEEF